MQDQNEKRLDMLKKRAKRCVCKFCGGPLSLRQLDFNEFEDARIEIFCDRCDRMEFGIEPEIYSSAQYYVEEYHINQYPDLGDNQMTRKMNIANVCDIMSWGLQNMGYLTKEGFKVMPEMEGNLPSECIILNDKMMDDLEKGLES